MSTCRALATVAVTLVLAAAVPSGAGAGGGGLGPLRMNETQVIGTHNSYHRELSGPRRAAHDAVYGGAPIYEAFLAYSHASLPNQLRRQGVRGLELDLFPDLAGGLYAYPLLRQRLTAGPLPDPEWRRPGIKVLHTEDFDYNTTCVRFVSCLRLVRRWSRSHAGHLPLL
jgi:Phosphoinositide phospholipase C, Ca2+-dependent